MNYQNDQYLYDHFFYQKKWPLFLGVFFFGIVAVVGAYDLFFNQADVKFELWKGLLVFIVGFAFFVLSLVACFFAKKRVSLGLNRNGLYVRYYGLVLWSQIKKIEIGWFGFGSSKQKCIFISLYDPESFFSSNPLPWWRAYRRATKDRIPIFGSTIPIKLKKLFGLLQTYQKDVLQNS